MKSKIKAGIIGLGVGAQHLETYFASPYVEVKAICDFNPEVLAQYKTKYPDVGATLKDLDVLDDPEISLVSICSNDDAHYEQIIRAIKNEKNIFVEKPLCLLEKETAKIHELLKAHPKVMLSSNLIMRRYPRFQALKKIIDENKLGAPYFLEGDYNYGRAQKLKSGWRGSIPNYSPLFGGGIHIVDMVMWLLQKRPRQVSAYSTKILTKDWSYKNYDTICAVMKFDTDEIAKVSVNLGCVYPHFHKFSVYGTDATFENDFDFAKLFTKRDPHRDYEKIVEPYPGATKGALLEDFILYLAGQIEDHAIKRREIFDVMAVCHAIDESQKEEKPVLVRYFD